MNPVSAETNSTPDTMNAHVAAGANAPLEKIALETYVPPAKPSLVGLSRAEIAEQLGAIGVAPAQRKMRVQQLCGFMCAAPRVLRR